MAILVSLIFLIPLLTAIYLEDKELVERYGDVHREYIKRTPAIIPWRKPLDFLRLMREFRHREENANSDQK
jgi:hypothetical protein